jgi:hypothetical protein
MKKQPVILLLFVVLPLICNFACTNTSKDLLALPCNVDSVSYKNDVVPILRSNCYKCHSAGNSVGSTGILLDTWDSLKFYARNNDTTNVSALVGVITNNPHNPNYPSMPYKLPALDSCSILKITFWVFQGALNN